MSKRRLAARWLRATGLGTVLRQLGTWQGLLVLTYHRISEAADTLLDYGVWSATPDALDQQLRFLKRHAEVITADDLPHVWRARYGRYVLVAFDDGYRDNYELAFPILRSHGLSAIFFLATGFLDHPRVSWWDEIAWMVQQSTRDELPAGRWLGAPLRLDEGGGRKLAVRALTAVYKSLPVEQTETYLDFLAEATGSGRCPPALMHDAWLTWDMARQMQAAGMRFGGHTVNHPVLARLPPADQRAEIEQCARRLEAELGSPMRWFSYPVGAPNTFSQATRQCLHDQGVRYAFSFYGGYTPFRGQDDYDLRRAAVSVHTTLDEVQALLALPALFARF